LWDVPPEAAACDWKVRAILRKAISS